MKCKIQIQPRIFMGNPGSRFLFSDSVDAQIYSTYDEAMNRIKSVRKSGRKLKEAKVVNLLGKEITA